METTQSVPAAGCRWITSERCRDPSTPQQPQPTAASLTLPDALTGFEEPPRDARGGKLNASRNRMRNSSVKRITAADVAHFERAIRLPSGETVASSWFHREQIED